MLRTAVRVWTTLLLALSVMAGFGSTGLLSSAGATGNICSPQGYGDTSGKIDTTGDPESVTVHAPTGKLIIGYCVKAGSEASGGGPEYVRVAATTSLTIKHSTKKAVSHYIVFYKKKDEPPTDKPSSSGMQTGPYENFDCEAGTATQTTTTWDDEYVVRDGQWVKSGQKLNIKETTKSVPVDQDKIPADAHCGQPKDEVETVVSAPEITCDGVKKTTTTTTTTSYEWIPGQGWEKKAPVVTTDVKTENLDVPPDSCAKPTGEIVVTGDPVLKCEAGTYDVTTTRYAKIYDWKPGKGWTLRVDDQGKPVRGDKLGETTETKNLASGEDCTNKPDDKVEQKTTSKDVCVDGVTETTTTTTTTPSVWQPGTGWVAGEPVVTEKTSTSPLVTPGACEEPATTGSDESGPVFNCEAGTLTTTTTSWDERYEWIPGQGWEKVLDDTGTPVRDNIRVVTDTKDAESPGEGCEPDETTGQDVAVDTANQCDGSVTRTTTTWDEAYEWIPGQGWEKEIDPLTGQVKRENVKTTTDQVALDQPPAACEDPSYEDEQSSSQVKCVEGIVTTTTTTTKVSYRWVPGQGFEQVSSDVVSVDSVDRPATAEECPGTDEGPTDECPQLEGEQPAGFDCEKAPDTRTVVQTLTSCELGNGVREGVITTTYAWDGTQWVGTDSGPVYGEWRYTPLTVAQEAELGCDSVVQPPEEICADIPGGEVVDGECTRPDETVDLFEELSRTCDGVTSRRGTVTTSFDYDATIGGFVATTTTSYEPPTTRQLTAEESAALGCDTVEPPEPIDPNEPVDPNEPTDPGDEPSRGPEPGPREVPTTGPAPQALPATGTSPGILGAGLLGTVMLLVGGGLLIRRRSVDG
ncbi:hypothetical protein KLP28_05780 [Nocardioidaceae bacterium]|nr:hypothetical protein KLP28_05780 [Nocardioidaceae bacterium]